MELAVSFKNGHHYQINEAKGEIQINGETLAWDISPIGENRFHIIYQNRSFEAEIEKIDFEQKQFKVKINGNSYEMQAKDRFDLLLEKLGMNKTASSRIKDLKAPMPGLILSILVKEGDEIKKDDKVMILEAMKMENVLKATGEGKVKAIKVVKGERVEKNHVLVVFE